jgi:hypothetical protein
MSDWFCRAATWPAFRQIGWRQANRMFFAMFVGGLVGVYVFILLADPYGLLPFRAPLKTAIVSAEPQAYPQILRSGRYDSLVVGTSISKLLDPDALDRTLGGHFANFAIEASSAGDQVQIMDYFQQTIADPKTLLVGLDHVWCGPGNINESFDPDFPSWAFDNSRWNDFLYLLNSLTLEIAGRAVAHLVGAYPEKMRRDGFEIFTPPEDTYDIARARLKLWGSTAPYVPPPPAPPLRLSDAQRAEIPLPTLPLLDQTLAKFPASTRKLLLFMPVHIAALPAPGSYDEARLAECKTRVTEIGRRYGALVVDWRIVSPLTTPDSNFWDQVHHRLPIAYHLIDQLGSIVSAGLPAPDGSYRILAR